MAQLAIHRESAPTRPHRQPTLSREMRKHLGTRLRQVYEQTLDTQPIPDSQVELLLKLRHKERDRQRGD